MLVVDSRLLMTVSDYQVAVSSLLHSCLGLASVVCTSISFASTIVPSGLGFRLCTRNTSITKREKDLHLSAYATGKAISKLQPCNVHGQIGSKAKAL